MQLERDFFSLLGLPRGFSVDDKLLKKNTRALLLRYHPDRNAQATPQERRLAEQFAAHVNRARDVLADPLQRAEHLLELAEVAVDFDRLTLRDSDFLMQQMALREELEEAVDAAACERLAAEVQQQLEQLYALFDSADFSAGLKAEDNGDNAAENAQQLLDALAKMHFYYKFADSVRIQQKALR